MADKSLLVDQARKGLTDLESVAKKWEQLYRDETVSYAPSEQISDEEVMSDVYQQILSSPALELLPEQEHQMLRQVQQLTDEKENEWRSLTNRQSDELQSAVQYLSEEEVNELSIRHFEERQLLESSWESKLEGVHEFQRKYFREWLLGVAEILETGGQLPRKPTDFPEAREERENEANGNVARLEESFTIQLGAQMKQSHNLRLVCGDVLDFCRLNLNSTVDPQRMQMSLSLYSPNLSGLVLLVDDRLSAYTGMEKEFQDICQRTAELHFSQADKQLENARQIFAREGMAWRKEVAETNDSVNASISQRPLKAPRSGDFYISRHSNLAQVHVVFHLVTDDSVHSSEVSSRHPVLLGLRHALRIAHLYDVNTLTLPLLLVHETSEQMTVAWCLRRAELVLKCVKGFMMELATYGGSNTQAATSSSGLAPTLQFLLPRDVSDEVFQAIASMLPAVFRVSNPLVLRSAVQPPNSR